MSLKEDFEAYASRMLSHPLAGQVSVEHNEHSEGEPEFVRTEAHRKCSCVRCKILRVKKVRMPALYPRTKCSECGELFIALLVDKNHPLCKNCQESTSEE